jgi:hypothetical protein
MRAKRPVKGLSSVRSASRRPAYARGIARCDTIDTELRIAAMVRHYFAELGEPMPSAIVLDEIRDERNSGRRHR